MFTEFCKRIGFKKEWEDFFIESYKIVEKNEKAFEILKEYAGMMLENKRCDAKLEEISALTGVHMSTAHVLVAVYAMITTEKMIEERGYDKEMLDWIMYDLRVKCDETYMTTKIIGSIFYEWYVGQVSLNRLCLGRLQYEYRTLTEFDYGDVKVGEKIINCHIPSGDPLTDESVMDSLKKAYDFFPDMRRDGVLTIMCNSWLLHPTTAKHCFTEGSNLKNFYDKFTIVKETEAAANHNFWRICGCDVSEIDNAPQETGLQRRLVKMIKSGINMGAGYAYLKFDGEKIVNK